MNIQPYGTRVLLFAAGLFLLLSGNPTAQESTARHVTAGQTIEQFWNPVGNWQPYNWHRDERAVRRMLDYCEAFASSFKVPASADDGDGVARLDHDVAMALTDRKPWPPNADSRVRTLQDASARLTTPRLISALACRSILEEWRREEPDDGAILEIQTNVSMTLTDQSILAEIAKHGADSARDIAAAKIVDQRLLADVILANLSNQIDSNNLTAVFAAITRISRQDVLVRLDGSLQKAELREVADLLLEMVRLERSFFTTVQAQHQQLRLRFEAQEQTQGYATGGQVRVSGAMITVTVEAPGRTPFSRRYSTVWPEKVVAGTMFVPPSPRFNAVALLSAINHWLRTAAN
jgi:hypothetical protein